MKTISLIRSFAFLSFLLCGAIQSIAENIEVDGVYYDYGSDFAWVTGCTDDVTDINIPEIITLEDEGYTFSLPVRYIENGAFRFKNNIQSAVINSKYIYEEAFYGCTGLETLIIGNESNSGIIIYDHAFTYCTGLKTVNLGKSVRSLRVGAFGFCMSLEDLMLSEGLKTIGSEAFGFCVSLTTIDFPSTLETIGNSAFGADSSLVSVTFPAGLKEIGDMAFALCYSLHSIDIPRTVTKIGNSAFGGCYNLSAITVEPGNYYYDSRDNCNAIIEKASKTLIAGCINTVIPNTVINIADNAFNRVGFESIIIPNSVVNIGEYAFYKCDRANDIKIGTSVKIIGNNAFRDCSNLRSLKLERSVEEIHMGAFMGCPLEVVTSLNPSPPRCNRDKWNDDDMFDWAYGGCLYVPKGCKEAYLENYGDDNNCHWYRFYEIKEIDFRADVNDDGEVNIADINAVIDMILSDKFKTRGDVNNDGDVNIADINAIIDSIFKG